MHRVYNSAFMHMLRDEDNAGYRRVLKETLEFDPEILKRYVNFMNNPDEKSAVEQFGKGDKYIGVATLLATLPGLPMLGPRPVRGLRREVRDGVPAGDDGRAADEWLIERHEREIVPLLHRRGDFAEARDFLLYDVASDNGGVDEQVFAYSNGSGPVAVAGRRTTTATRRPRAGSAIRSRSRSRRADGSKRLERRTLAQGLGLADGDPADRWLAMPGAAVVARVPALGRGDPRARDARHAARLRDARVLGAPRAVTMRPASGGGWPSGLAVRGVPSLEGALRELQLAPVHDALRAAMAAPPRPGGGAAGRRGRRRDRDERRPACRRRGRPGAAPGDGTGRHDDRRRLAGGGAAAVGAARAARVAAAGRERRRDEPGVVRGAPSRAGRRRRAARWRPRRGAPRGAPRSGSGCCWTCRCRRRSAARPTGCRCASWTSGWPTRSSDRSCGSTAGTTRTGSTASRGSSSSPGPIASSAP